MKEELKDEVGARIRMEVAAIRNDFNIVVEQRVGEIKEEMSKEVDTKIGAVQSDIQEFRSEVTDAVQRVHDYSVNVQQGVNSTKVEFCKQIKEIADQYKAVGQEVIGIKQRLDTIVTNTSGSSNARVSWVPGDIGGQSTQHPVEVANALSAQANITASNESDVPATSVENNSTNNAANQSTNRQSDIPPNLTNYSNLIPWATNLIETEEDRFRMRLRKQHTTVPKYKGYDDDRNICAFLREVELHMWRHARTDQEKVDMLFSCIDHKKNEWASDPEFWQATSRDIVKKIRNILWDHKTQNLELQKFHDSEYGTGNSDMVKYLMAWYEKLCYLDHGDEETVIDYLVNKLPNRMQCSIGPSARSNISIFKKRLMQLADWEDLRNNRKKKSKSDYIKDKKDSKNKEKKHLNSNTSR